MLSKLPRSKLGKFCGCWPAVKRTDRCPSMSYISKEPIKMADPGIYSQRQIYQFGALPSWDNRDIQWVDSHTVKAQVRNFSRDFPAGGVAVHCDLSAPGIGMPWTRVGSQKINLNPLEEKSVYFTVSDPARFSPERSTRIVIDYHRDLRYSNNYGEQQLGRILTRNPHQYESSGIPIFNYSQESVVWRVMIIDGNGDSIRVINDNLVLDPGQGVGLKVVEIIPPDDHGAEWEATVFVDDAQGNLIGGITLQTIAGDD